jgi:hypothetical protein
MPVQYSPLPEFQAPNVNLLGAYAQGQALASNRLRDQVLQNELAQQERMRGVITQPGFNLNDPRAIQQLTEAGALDEAIKLRTSQDESRVRRAQESNYLNDILMRQKKFDAELPNIRAMTKEHLAQANQAELKLFSESTGAAQDLISRVAPDGSDWPEKRELIRKLDPTLNPPEQFNKGWNERALQTAKMMQDVATDITKKRMESQIPKVVAPTENMPGMLVGPSGVEKLPQVAPGSTAWGPEVPAPVVRPPNAMTANPPVNNMGKMLPPDAMNLSPEAQAIQATMAEEQKITQGAPIGREKEALGKYRFGKTLRNMGNTFIDLAKNNGIVVPGETPEETFQALANQTKAGEILGKMDASERLALVDQLKSQIVTAIPQFAAAAGLQSKNFDSEKEGERLMRALADPNNIANISSAFRILNDLNTQFGTGVTLFEPKKEIGGILGLRGQTKTPNAPKKLEGPIDYGDME